MSYKFAPITVDLSAFGEGLFAKCLHPRLQPLQATKSQQRILTKAIGSLPPDLLTQLEAGDLDFETLPMEVKAQLAPLIAEQMEAQMDLVAGCVITWNLTDMFTGEPLEVPRLSPEGRDILNKVPGAVVSTIVTHLQGVLYTDTGAQATPAAQAPAAERDRGTEGPPSGTRRNAKEREEETG